MELNVKLDPMAYLPDRAHPTDAGLAEEITGGPRGDDGYGSTVSWKLRICGEKAGS